MLEHTEIAKKFYNSSNWKRTRKAYYQSQHGICERCEGVSNKMIVHHKIYIDKDNVNNPDVTLNFENLELVCL